MSIIDVEKLQELIEEDINPALGVHNGFVVLDAVEDGEEPKVFLSFFGGCQGCPSSFTMTLSFIENFLRTELEMDNLKVINTETT